MTDITLTDNQADAVAQIKRWFESLEFNEERKLLPGQPQVFRVFGYAGTGKTTITKHAIGELGLEMEGMSPDVRFAAFTGKASYVMRKHGTPARTIHSLIYRVAEATEAEIEQAKEKLEKLKVEAISVFDRTDRLMVDAQIGALETEIRGMKKPRFGLNDESEVKNANLVVLDEVSMVGHDMATDLLSFGKPILVLGDPGQLPPIKGEGAFTQQKPDVMLTEIHRQAGESAIIRLATLARQGQAIPYGQHDEFVWKLTRYDVGPQQLLRGGQVICGRNATRLELNNAMRRAAGFDPANPLPTEGEKIICLKNDNARGLINGMFLELSDVQPYRPGLPFDGMRFKARARTEDGHAVGATDYEADDARVSFDPIDALDSEGEVKRESSSAKLITFYAGHFLDHLTFDKERGDRDWKAKKGLVEATFGWAITCHKAQGSQWENVIVWDDGLGRTAEDRQRWLYTAITRAERGLVILD